MNGDDAKDLEDVKKLLKEINELYRLMGKDNPFEVSSQDLANMTDYTAEYTKQFEQLKLVKNEWRDYNSSVLSTFDTIKNIADEVGAGIDPLKKSKSIYKGIQSIGQDIVDDALNVNKMSEKELRTKKKQMEVYLENLALQAQELQTKEELTEEDFALLAAAEEGYSQERRLIALLDDRIEKEVDIKNTVGLTGQFLKGASGVLTKMGFDADIFKEALTEAEEAAEDGAGHFGAMWAGVKVWVRAF